MMQPAKRNTVRSRRQWRSLLFGVAACMLALLVGYWKLHRSQPAATPHGSDPFNSAPSAAAMPPRAGMVPDQALHSSEVDAVTLVPDLPSSPLRHARPIPRPEQQATTAVPARSTASPMSHGLDLPEMDEGVAGTGHSFQPPAAMPGVRVPVTSAPRVGSAPLIRPARPSAKLPIAVSESTLARELDSPRLPGYASDPQYYDLLQRRWPRLLRRGTSAAGPASEEDSDVVASVHAPDLPGTPGRSKAVSAAVVHSGIVRPTCLGMMAGNLEYSPAPAFPVAAAAAGVQGEVRIEATVDRDGSIASARVVSGHPLLREAALDAVQQWRYRPYSVRGKAIPAGTIAVLEFVLP